jgi:hypothetical protein
MQGQTTQIYLSDISRIMSAPHGFPVGWIQSKTLAILIARLWHRGVSASQEAESRVGSRYGVVSRRCVLGGTENLSRKPPQRWQLSSEGRGTGCRHGLMEFGERDRSASNLY